MKSLWITLLVFVVKVLVIETCIIPTIQNGHVVSTFDDNELPVGLDYDDFAPVQVNCSPGFSLFTIRSTGNKVFCKNDNWDKNFKKCQKLCLNSELIDYTAKTISCKRNGTSKSVKCDRNQAPGTQVEVQCQSGYTKNELPVTSNHFTCLPNGKWSHPPYRCFAVCGLQTPIGTHFIVHGQQAGKTEAPWNVAVYKNLEHICGGTILTEKIVLSAAHCFYNETDGQVILNPVESFKIVAGKHNRDFHKKETFETQIFDASKIESHQEYRGKSNLNVADIAYVVLDGFIRFELHIAPICLNYNVKYSSDREIVPGSKGLVVGWGLTEAFEKSETLKSIEVPVISYEQCKREASLDFKAFVTKDKLCFGYLDGSGTCTGDSGAGLVIPDSSGTYFLRGIVSFGKASIRGCDMGFYTLYTNVLDYIEFIKSAISSYPSYLEQGTRNTQNRNQQLNAETTSMPFTSTKIPMTQDLETTTQTYYEPCELNDGLKGQCVPSEDCDYATKFYQGSMQGPLYICDNRLYNFKVCCPNPKPKSEKYCDLIKSLKSVEIGSNKLKLDDALETESNKKSERYTFVVGIGILTNFSQAPIVVYCGGALISKTWVLSLASTNDDYDFNYVRLGGHSEATDFYTYIAIKSTHKHPSYLERKIYNDIALVELITPVVFDLANIFPICLPMIDSESVDDKYSVAGWNLRIENKAIKLIKSDTIKISIEKCNAYALEMFDMFPYYMNEGLENSQICTDSTLANSSTCNADAGSPLFSQEPENGTFFLYGVTITDLGNFCRKTDIDKVLFSTRVSSHLDWIEKKVWPGDVEL